MKRFLAYLALGAVGAALVTAALVYCWGRSLWRQT
jgi:hypothetical protein